MSNTDSEYNRQPFYELADELERDQEKEPGRYDTIIKRLRGLEYDDFANTEFAAPKIQMVQDLEAADRPDLAERVKDGDFDQ